jgi:hypothetical protein
MSTQPATAKPPRRRRKVTSAAKPNAQTRTTPCGREARGLEHFFAIRFQCGATLWQSYAALSRGICPDCLVDRLHEHGYVSYGDPIRATFTLDGDCRTGPYGTFGGIELAGYLARLSTPASLEINHHTFDFGEC